VEVHPHADRLADRQRRRPQGIGRHRRALRVGWRVLGFDGPVGNDSLISRVCETPVRGRQEETRPVQQADRVQTADEAKVRTNA
jgi:hypothetical protein